MGCCQSAAGEVLLPTKDRPQIKKVQQTDSSEQGQNQPSSNLNDQGVEKQIEIETNNQNIKEQVNKKDDHIQKIRKFIQQKRKQNSGKKYEINYSVELVSEIEEQIFSKTLSLDNLLKIVSKENIPIETLLLFKNQQGNTILEQIITFLPDYEILTYFFTKCQITKIEDSLQLAIKILDKIKPFGKNQEENIQASLNFLNNIQTSPQLLDFFEELSQYDIEKYVNLLSYFDIRKESHLKLLSKLLKLFQSANEFWTYDNAQFYLDVKDAKQKFCFTNHKISKQIPLGDYQEELQVDLIELKELKFNIFHQVALNNKWDIFIQYSNRYIQEPNIQQITPFMIFIEKAPLDIIYNYILTYQNQLTQGLQHSTLHGKNLIHCLSSNKEVLHQKSILTLDNIITIIQQQNEIKQLLVQPYNDQIPLVHYLDQTKEYNQNFIDFLSQNIKKQFDTKHLINSINENVQQLKYKPLYSKQSYYKHIQNLNKHTRQQKKFLQKYRQQTNYNEYEEFYYQYIQLIKQIIKSKLKVNFNWITDFNCYTSFYPYDLGTTQQTFLNLLARVNQLETLKIVLEQLKYSQEINDISFIAKLISLKKELQQSTGDVNILNQQIDTIIINTIQQNPIILIEPISQYHDFSFVINKIIITEQKNKLLQYDTLYTLILQLKDGNLFQQCIQNQQIDFSNKQDVAIMILYQLFDLKLIQNFEDKVLLSLIKQLNLRQGYFSTDFYTTQDEPTEQEIKNILFCLQNFQYSRYSRIRGFRKPKKNSKIKNRNSKTLKYVGQDFFKSLLDRNNNLNMNQKSLYKCLKLQKCLQASFDQAFKIFNLKQIWYIQELIKFNVELLEDLGRFIYLNQSLFQIKPSQYKTCYSWQMLGANFKFIMNNKIQSLDLQDYREKVIQFQIQNKCAFLESMIVFDECHNDLIIYLQSSQNFNITYRKQTQDKSENFEVNQNQDNNVDQVNVPQEENQNLTPIPYILTKNILENKAIKNLKYIVDYYQIGILDLVQYLAQQYFSKRILMKCNFYSEKWIQQFNQQISELLKYLPNNSTRKQQIFALKDYIRYLNIENYVALKNMYNIKFFQIYYYDLIRSTDNDQIDNQILVDVFNNFQLDYYDIKKLISIMILKPQLVTTILQLCLSKQLTYSQINSNCFYLTAYQQNQNLVIDLLNNSVINPENMNAFKKLLTMLYSISISYRYFESLDRLLVIKEQQQFENLTLKLHSHSTTIDTKYFNYVKAFNQECCIPLSTQDYINLLKKYNLNQQTLFNHFKLCLEYGYWEKLNEILSKLQNNYNEDIFNLLKSAYKLYVKELFNCQILENDNKLQQIKLHFPLQIEHPYEGTKVQIKQLISQVELQQKAYQITNQKLAPIKYLEKYNKNVIQFYYKQNRQLAKQRGNQFIHFDSLYSSDSNYQKCFDLIIKYGNWKLNTEESTLIENVNLILNPQIKKIKNSSILVEFIINMLKNKKSQLFLQNIKIYLELLYQNYDKEFYQNNPLDFNDINNIYQAKVIQQILFKCQIFKIDHDLLERAIVDFEYQDKAIVKLLEQNFNELSQFKFNKSTLFYAKLGVKLLKQQSYDILSYHEIEINDNYIINRLERRLLILQQYFDLSQLNLKQLTSNEIYLIFGRQDHIQNQLQFNLQYLYLALISQNIETILYVLNLDKKYQEPSITHKVFQILIINNLSDIQLVNYFNKFIKNKIQNVEQLMQVNDKSLLYYIFLCKKQQLFETIYNYLIQIKGENQASQIIKDQLQNKYSEEETSLQFALKQQNYYILSYCEGILTQFDLEAIQSINIGQINYFLNVKLENVQNNYQKFIKLFQENNVLMEQQYIFEEKQKKEFKTKQLNEMLLLIKACINKLFAFPKTFYLKNTILTLQLAFDQWEILQLHNYDQKLIKHFINQFYDTQGNLNIPDNQFKTLIENCQNYVILNTAVFSTIALSNPKLFIQIINPEYLTLELIVSLCQVLKRTVEFNAFIQNVINNKQIHNFILKFLNAIYTDDYKDSQLANDYHNYIVQLSHVDKLFSKNQNHQKWKLTPATINYLKQLLISKHIDFQNYNVFETILENYNCEEQGIIQGVIFTAQIINQVNDFKSKIKDFCDINLFKFEIVFNGDQIKQDNNVFILPFQFFDNQIILFEELIELLLPQLKLQKFQSSLKQELQNFIQNTEGMELFDLNSLINVDFSELIINIKNFQFEKCLFFKDLMKEYPTVGIYEIDDVFAPHQHDSIRQADLHQTQTMLQRSISANQASVGPQQNRQISQNQQQIMKEDFQFMFELLPDNTYQVRQRTQKHNQKQLIFPEFYHFVQPCIILNLDQVSEENYITQYNGNVVISLIIADFYRYSEFISNLIEDKKVQEQWIVNFPFFIIESQIIYQDQLFSTYIIQIVFIKLANFIDKIQHLPVSEEDGSKLIWRINSTSLLEVIVSKLVELEGGNQKIINILSILDQVLSWNSLVTILHQILNNNLNRAQSVLKVIKGVYVEFNEISDCDFNVIEDSRGLDKIFQFGKTTYHIYNHMLIIRLNIIINNSVQSQDLFQQVIKKSHQSENIFKPNAQIQSYFHNIINQFDFYNQIFTPDQLVQFLFNKLEVDRALLKHSNELSKQLNKTITISVDHSSLSQIFSYKIQQINQNQNNFERLKEFESVWYILQKLNRYFQEDILNYLKKQLNSERFSSMFNIRLFSLLLALKEQVSVHEITSNNVRQLNSKKNSNLIQNLGPFCKNKNINFSYYFGFQLHKSYFINNIKLGDICIILYNYNQQYQIRSCQLVYNQKPGQFLFIDLNKQIDGQLSQDRITRNQNYYSSITLSTEDFIHIQIEDLQSLILFQTTWPSDPLFQSSIFNVFFIDSEGNLLLCNETEFLVQMNKIQNEQDDFAKQELLDKIFGSGQLSPYNEFTLTSLTPLFPEQINFEFQGQALSLKKQQSVIQGSNINIRINEDKFKIDPIEINPICISCYFESQQTYQTELKQLKNFVNLHPELSDLTSVFDDSMNKDPEHYTDLILTNQLIFESFKLGYESFLQEQFYPLITNSLQYLLGITSINEIKKQFIKKVCANIEFTFKLTYEDINENNLIQYDKEKKLIRINTFIVSDEYVLVASSQQITKFYQELVLQFKENSLQSFLLINDNYSINMNTITVDNYRIVTDIMFLINPICQLLECLNQDNQYSFQIISKSQIKSNFTQTIYQFGENNEIIFNFDTFQDFNLSDILLDVLNNSPFYLRERYSKINYNYIGPEIITEKQEIELKNWISNLEGNEALEYKIFYQNKSINQITNYFDPQEFQELLFCIKIQGTFQIVISIKSIQYHSLMQYYLQNQNEQLICNDFFILIYNIHQEQGLDNQLNKFNVYIDGKYDDQHVWFTKQQKSKDKTFKISYQLITNNIILMQLKSQKSKILQFNSKFNEFSYSNNQKQQNITVKFITQSSVDLTKTLHQGVLLHDNQTFKQDLQTKIEKRVVEQNKIISILAKKQEQNSDEILTHNMYQGITHSEELQSGNSINMLSKQEMDIATRAGQQRTDFIQFQDNLGNMINQNQHQLLKNILFVHSLYPQIQYIPQLMEKQDHLELIWTPTFKGIQGKYIVLANEPCPEKSIIERQEDLSTLPYYEIIQFAFQLKDEYLNIYGDIEYLMYPDAKCSIKKVTGESKEIISFKNITKLGQQNATIHLEPLNADDNNDEVTLQLIINNKIKQEVKYQISGICLEKRRRKFDQELPKHFRATPYSLTIRRMNFLQDLLTLVDKSMVYNFTIKFQDEPGIDAGGLKREFYDMIGNTLKDENYKFFTPVQGNLNKYFLNKNFNRLKNKEKYAQLFGKLIANSIGNGYLIGIDIVAPFWKVIYDDEIEIQDLKLILDKQTYANYEYLSQLSQEELESMCLDFTYQSGNTTVELIPNGKNIQVTLENIDDYLKKTANYIVHLQYETIFKHFKEGFKSVLDIKILEKWIRSSEISLLTQGLLEIEPDVILQKITYSGGKAVHKQFFQTYISKSDSQTLKCMLKFITGSSSIPFDQSNYVISVEFRSNLDIRKLPLSHTCFKSIEIPLYTSYSQMKQKLDIAFTIGAEGYGFG